MTQPERKWWYEFIHIWWGIGIVETNFWLKDYVLNANRS